jgi:hypothetical protein
MRRQWNKTETQCVCESVKSYIINQFTGQITLEANGDLLARLKKRRQRRKLFDNDRLISDSHGYNIVSRPMCFDLLCYLVNLGPMVESRAEK